MFKTSLLSLHTQIRFSFVVKLLAKDQEEFEEHFGLQQLICIKSR